MAEFNPDVKETNPSSFLGLSKPISSIDGDSSIGKALGSIGQTATMALTAKDDYTKKQIETNIYAAVDAENDSYVQKLEDNRQSSLLAPPAAGASAAATAIADAPKELQQLDAKAQRLVSARDAGSLNETDFKGRIDAMAKFYRSNYPPEYRPYIDATMSKASGLPIADSYRNALVADSNRAGEKKDVERNATLGVLRSLNEKGVPNMNILYDKYQTGQASTSEVNAEINRAMSNEFRTKQLKDQFALRKDIREDDQQSAADLTNNLAQGAARTYFQGIQLQAGKTPQQITQLVEDSQLGKDTGVDWETMASNVEAYKAKARRELIMEGQKPGTGDDKRSLSTRMGPAAFNKSVDDNLAVFDDVVNNIRNKDYGRAFDAMRRTAAIDQQEDLRLMTDPSIGGMTRLNGAAERKGGKAFAEVLAKLNLTNNMVPKIKNYLDESNKRFIAQTQPEAAAAGAPANFKAAVTKLQQNNVTGARSYQALIDMSQQIYDPKYKLNDEGKISLADKFFSPENRDSLANFERTDATGRPELSGKYGVFSNLTVPGMTKEMRRLADVSPEGRRNWNNYVNWAETSFSNELFSKELKGMNEIQLAPGSELSWDTTNNRFDIIRNGSSILGRRNQPNPDAQRLINRINGGIDSISNIAKELNNGDVTAYMIDLLNKNGVKMPDKQFAGSPVDNHPSANYTSITESIANALSNSVKKIKTRQEMIKETAKTTGDEPFTKSQGGGGSF